MDTLAIKGTVTDLKGPIADQLNALGKELLYNSLFAELAHDQINRGQVKQGIKELHTLLSHWLTWQQKADPLNDDSIDPESDDINTHMLFTQFMRIEQQIAIYYQAAFNMLVEKGLEAVARSLPVPPCIFPDDAGPDNWEYWTDTELLEFQRKLQYQK